MSLCFLIKFQYPVIYYLLNRFTKATRTGSLAQLVKEVKQCPSIHLKVYMNVNKVVDTVLEIIRYKVYQYYKLNLDIIIFAISL